MIKKYIRKEKKTNCFLIKKLCMYEYFIIIKKKSTRTQNKIMKKRITKITSKTY